MRACQLGIPAVLLIRHPDEAVISYRALIIEASALSESKDTYEALNLRDHLQAWISFYERLKSYAENLVVATFEQVTTDLGAVTQRVNDRYGSSFTAFTHTGENLARTRERKGFHALPNQRRQRIKISVREEFERAIAKEQPQLLDRSRCLYDFYCGYSGA